VKYQFIAEHQGEVPVKVMCRVLDVSESGYYVWRERPEPARQQADRLLIQQIGQIFRAGRGVYGSPRVHAALQHRGIRCSRKRVARLMRQAGLTVRPARHTIRTTDSHHANPVAPNLLNRDFHAAGPNEKWVGDITGIWTAEGWLYLAGLVDCYSRMLVGWAMSSSRDEVLVEKAFQMALGRRQLGNDLLHHSDRGSQYTSGSYRAVLAERDITVSMSRKGDCWDNAMMESFWGTVKTECVERQVFATRHEARAMLFDYLEIFYNRQRLHSSLGYQSPADFEQKSLPSDSFKTL
jgi:putative transposase